MAVTEQTRKLLALSFLKGVGPASMKKAMQLKEFSDAGFGGVIESVPAIAKAVADRTALDRALDEAGRQVEEAARYDARIISPFDRDYPQLLATTADDPLLLSVRGSLAADPEASVAVIGTRHPTKHGAIITRRICSFLVENRVSVVSGLALGCDALAHEATLDEGGHTVAVLAHGLQMVAPATNRRLAERILDAGGAWVSEFRFGQQASPQQFVRRDRTQAGLAQGVVMVQSDLAGGSLHASRASLDYGRWLAIPYPTAQDRGNNEPKVQANLLVAQGPAQSAADLLRCRLQSLADVHILNSREDYPLLLQRNKPANDKRKPLQAGLL